MRRLTTRIRSEQCVVGRFCRCANVYLHRPRQYSLIHTYSIWYCLLPLGFKPVQHVTVLNTVGKCDTVVRIIILYYNLMGPPSYMRSVVDRNVVMRRIPVLVTGGKNTRTPRHNQLQLCSSLQVYVNYTILLLARHLRGPGSVVWAGQRSQYSDWLRAGRSKDRIPVGARFSAPIQTGSATHPASCKWVPGLSRG